MKKYIRRFTSFALAVFLLAGLLFDSIGVSAFAVDMKAGDVNQDGIVDEADALLVKNHIMEYAPITSESGLLAADVNNDGKISALDYVRIKNSIENADVVTTLHFNKTEFADQSIVFGEPVSLPVAVQDGYVFAGWYIIEANCYVEGVDVDYWIYTSENGELNLAPIFKSVEEVSDGMKVSAGKDTLEFRLGNLGTAGKVYSIYAINSAEYYKTESETGQFHNETNGFESGSVKNVVSSGELIGWYLGGSDYRFSISRYDETGYDYAYKKYYVVSDEDVAKGPVWVNEFTDRLPVNDYAYASEALMPNFDPLSDPTRNKKGVCSALSPEQTEFYGNAYEPIGMPLIAAVQDGHGQVYAAGIIAPNEIVNEETGEITYRGYDYYHDKSILPGEAEADPSKGAADYPYLEIQSNGTYYYINRLVLAVIDNGVVAAYHSNMYSIGIMTINMWKDQEVLPYYMQYPGMEEFVNNKTDPKANATFQQANTSNQIGANYWIALMEFFAWRYAELGLIDVVLGNEVDFAGAWNVTADYTTTKVTTEQYSEELYRAVRLASIAFNKYTDKMDMSLSFTHYWNGNGAEGGNYTYQPHQIVEYMLKKSNAEGNFRWGLTVHDYAYNLAANNVFNGDYTSGMVNGDFNTTKCITITNLEVLEQYLEQDYARYNGNLRPVYLTETGINTGKDNTEAQQKRQAAAIIYHYYKIMMLDAVVCWPYYRLVDNPAENLPLGLYSDAAHPRLSNQVWADLGRLSIDEINDKYKDCLQENLKLFDADDDYGTIMQKMADLLGVDYDWNAAWKEYYDYTVRSNRFTASPADEEVTYTGKPIALDKVKAYKGTVQYKFFDENMAPISEIKDVGTYKYVAYVTETEDYDGIESEAHELIVTKAENALVFPVIEGTIYLAEVEGGISLPENITRFGSPDFTVKNSNNEPVTTLTSGKYTLTVGAVADTKNYSGLPAGEYTIEVTGSSDVSTYEELVDVLNDYYANPIPSAVINLTTDIDCGEKQWNVNDDGKAFTATFNGNGHTISNLKMGTIGDNRIGLFQKLGNNAVVKDLNIADIKVDLHYSKNDTSYNAPVSVGILASEVIGTKVQVSSVTVSDVQISVVNRSAKDHTVEIGGIFGTDLYTTAKDASEYLRSKLAVKNFNVSVVENAENLWIGGIAGTLEGAAPSTSSANSQVVYSACTVEGGTMTMFDPAGKECAVMGAYIGRLNNYMDITMKDKCTADIKMVRYDSRVEALMSYGLVDQAMPDPMAVGNYARYMPSNYYHTYSGSKNTLGWFGMQTNITGKYFETAVENNTVDGKLYTRSTFNIGSKCTCNAEMSAENYIEQDVTVTEEQLNNGFKLEDHSLYVGNTLTDIQYFTADFIRQTVYANTWSSATSNYDADKSSVMYSPTRNDSALGAANCIGYWYNPEWNGAGNGALGWCSPYESSGACYIDISDAGYMVTELTKDDFADLDSITVYGLVTAKNGDQCWYDVIKLNVSREEKKHDTEGVLFLGDSLCGSALYIADTKPVLNNYIVNPYEIHNARVGDWKHSGGWAYLYAQNHPTEMVYNYGVGGATMADFGLQQGTTIAEEYDAFKAENSNAKLNRIVVQMSLNDLLLTDIHSAIYGSSVAKQNDFTQPLSASLKATTLGSVVTLIQTIREDYPDAELVFMTSSQRFDYLYPEKGNSYRTQVPVVHADLATICKAMEVPVIDLWNKSGLESTLDEGKTWNYLYYSEREGTHPGPAGYATYLYPCMMSYLDDGDESVLLFECDWINKETVTFTKAPQALNTTYTGSALEFAPSAEASWGIVTYKYYDMDGNELDEIVDAGTYQYKAYVKGNPTHRSLESDYIAIHVDKADNSFVAGGEPKPIAVVYTGNAAQLAPSAAASDGTVEYEYYNADKETIEKSEIVNVGTYYYKAIVAESANYNMLESNYVLITVGNCENSFTTEASAIEVDYTGKAAELNPAAASTFGTVTYKYYDSGKNEIQKSAIVNAGSYYFKAVVAGGDFYNELSSGYLSITVKQATNGLVFSSDGESIIELPFEDNGAIPDFVKFGKPDITISKGGIALGETDKLEMNTDYTLIIGAVSATDNYTGFAGGEYTLKVIGERESNSFTTAPTAIEVEYDGSSDGITPSAAAAYGTVTYTYYKADKSTEIAKTDIVNAGTYYFKAAVAQTNRYEGVASDFVMITVKPATISFIDGWTATNGVISLNYDVNGITVPTALTNKTANLTFKVTNAANDEVSKLTMGNYTLSFTGAANYKDLADSYTIHVNDKVTISSYEELIGAMDNYYANPSDEAVLTLSADIDAAGAEWTILGDNTFMATFDGNGKKISNLKVTDGSQQYIGLFSKLGDGAVVKNLTISKATIALAYAEGDTTYSGPVSIGVLAGQVVGTKVKVSGVTISDPTINVTNDSAIDHEMEIGGVFGLDHYTNTEDATDYLRKNITVSGLNAVVNENAERISMGGIAGTILGASALKGADGSSLALYDTCVVNTSGKGKLELYDPAGTVKRGMGAYAGQLKNYTLIGLTNCQSAIPLRLLDARITVLVGGAFVDWVMPELLTDVYTNFASYYPSSFNPGGNFAWLGWFGMQNGCENRYWSQTDSNAGFTVSEFINNGSTCETVMRTLSNVSGGTVELSVDDLKDGGYPLDGKSLFVGGDQTDTFYFRSDCVGTVAIPGKWEVNTKKQSTLNAMVPMFQGYTVGYWHDPIATQGSSSYRLGWVVLHLDGSPFFDPHDPNLNMATRTLTEADFANTDTVTLYAYDFLKPADVTKSVWGYYLSREVKFHLTKQDNSFTVEPQDLAPVTYTGSALSFAPDAAAAHGTVTYKYYDSDKKEVSSITNAGTYYYKAFVASDAECSALESDFKTITVSPAENSFTTQAAAVTKTYDGTSGNVTPSAAAAFGQVNYKFYSDADCTAEIQQSAVVGAGTYYCKAFVTQTDNYGGLESGAVTITVNKADNSLTEEPENLTLTYTGSSLSIEPTAMAANGGQVTFKFYSDAETTVEIQKSAIVDGGTYYFTAVVAADDNYKAFTSQPCTITVNPAQNGLTFEPVEGVITVAYADEGAIPAFVKYGDPAITISRDGVALGQGEKLEMNLTYTIVIGAVAATGNYTALEGGTYTLKVVGEPASNQFTTEPAAITKGYDGTSNGIEPAAVAQHGTVTYKYYFDAACQTEIDKTAIVDAGTYYYKAFVEQTNWHEGLESDAKTITVKKAEFTFTNCTEDDGVLLVGYAGASSVTLGALTSVTTNLTYVVTNADGNVVGSKIIDMGKDYTVTFTGYENYKDLNETYTIRYGISTYAELNTALHESSVLPLLTLIADIDCADGPAWAGATAETVKDYKGTFDGQGHTISNLTMNETGGLYYGLFPKLNAGAVIKNLTIDSAVVDLKYTDEDAAPASAVEIGILCGWNAAQTVTVSDVTISNASVTVSNLSANDHTMYIGGVFGFDRATQNKNLASYKRENISVDNFCVDVSENAAVLYVGGIAGVLSGKDSKSDEYISVYNNCDVTGGELKVYDPLGTQTRAMGAYFGCLSGYCGNLQLKNCQADIALTMIDARTYATIPALNTAADWIMPDKNGSNHMVSYMPSSFNLPVGDTNMLGWIGMQSGANNRYWATTSSLQLSSVVVDNSACTSVMRTVCSTEQTLEVSRSQFVGGQLDLQGLKSDLYGVTAGQNLTFFLPENIEKSVMVNSVYNVGTGEFTGESVLSPWCDIGGPYQIAYWYGGNAANASTDPNVSKLGWNLFYGAGGAVYFNPIAFGFAKDKLTEADFAGGSVKLYGLVTVSNVDAADQGNWGWKQVIELTVTLTD